MKNQYELSDFQYFDWGVATSAFQNEGAHNIEGKGPSIWDEFTKSPNRIIDGSNANISCDHYHRFLEDIKLMQNLGINSYRLSFSWSRIFPNGKGKTNPQGVKFYHKLLDALLQSNIKPLVTLYHWDLPNELQKKGGWINRETINSFCDYAAFCFEEYGKKVNEWITLNEPFVCSMGGYASGIHAPGEQDFSKAIQVSHHLMLAHSKVVGIFKKNGNSGKIGITMNLNYFSSESNFQENIHKTKLLEGIANRWFLNVVMTGKYPEDILSLYQNLFKKPVFHDDDVHVLCQGKPDFIGVNYYSRKSIKIYQGEQGFSLHHLMKSFEPEWNSKTEKTALGWEVFPEGLGLILKEISELYDYPELKITENGAAFRDDVTEFGIIQDDDRISYLQRHIAVVKDCLSKNIKITGYYIWSLMDNFEWSEGYTAKFGLFHVDFQTMERSPKKSAIWLKHFLESQKMTCKTTELV